MGEVGEVGEEEGEREGGIPRSPTTEHTQALRVVVGRVTGGGEGVGGEGEGDATGVNTHLEAAAEVEHTRIHVDTGPNQVAIYLCMQKSPYIAWLH